MIVLLIILMVFLALLTFLLVTPILLEIDTDSERPLVLTWRGILRLSLVMDADKFCGEVKILGFKKEFQFKSRGKKHAKKKRNSKLTFHKVLNVLRSFPFALGEYTCVPVIRVGFGFGGGGGTGEVVGKNAGTGGGGGAGMGIEPVGFLVAKADQISFISTHHSKGLSAALEKVPYLLAKYFETHPSGSATKAEAPEKVPA
jgi:uncharacterized spore protein YtfJ